MKKIDFRDIMDIIESRRVELGLSQQELAERVYMTPSNYSRYKNDRRDMPTTVLLSMLNALGLEMRILEVEK